LRGIGSTNLESVCEIVVPSIRSLDFIEFFDRPQSTIMPYPLVYNNYQRPSLH
jgi:hypothetical protein